MYKQLRVESHTKLSRHVFKKVGSSFPLKAENIVNRLNMYSESKLYSFAPQKAKER